MEEWNFPSLQGCYVVLLGKKLLTIKALLPFKRQELLTDHHSTTSQKTSVSSNITVRTSNLISCTVFEGARNCQLKKSAQNNKRQCYLNSAFLAEKAHSYPMECVCLSFVSVLLLHLQEQIFVALISAKHEINNGTCKEEKLVTKFSIIYDI